MSLVYDPVVFLVKLSLLLLYYRIFSVDTAMRYLTIFGIVFHLLFTLAFIGFNLALETLCVSINSLSIPLCRESWKGVIVQSVMAVATDFYVLCLPLPMIWRLQHTLRRKIELNVVFMLGLM